MTNTSTPEYAGRHRPPGISVAALRDRHLDAGRLLGARRMVAQTEHEIAGGHAAAHRPPLTPEQVRRAQLAADRITIVLRNTGAVTVTQNHEYVVLTAGDTMDVLGGRTWATRRAADGLLELVPA